MLEDSLMKLGLSPSEIKVYMFLVNEGSSYASKISSGTNLNRTNVYEALDRLISKGLVSYIIKNKVKWIEAKPLNSLILLIRNKEQDFANLRKSLIDDIKGIKPADNKIPLEASIFVGKKGLRMLFEEILENRNPVSWVASQLQFKEFFGPYFELWHKNRAKKRIIQRSIWPISFKDKLMRRKLLKYKFINDKFTSPTTTVIYGDNCLFIQWSKEPIAIKIHNKEIAKSHLNYFNMLWHS
ncbi:hypothetical protein HYT57_01745 [Candidatus Woesearchaeota archaeon]|nr:hypothetical protein [Candidatus Woesearchaeota archaeon]